MTLESAVIKKLEKVHQKKQYGGTFGKFQKTGGTIIKLGIWGNQLAECGGTDRDDEQSAAFKKLNKSPLKLRLAKEKGQFWKGNI